MRSKSYRAGVTSLSIAAAGERTGVSPYTLRYYERIGLIDPVGRDEGGRRVKIDRYRRSNA